MSQRFSLFYAGFTANTPAMYFEKMSFLKEHELEPNDLIHNCIIRLSGEIIARQEEFTSYLKIANSLAARFDFGGMPEPSDAEAYTKWLSNYIQIFENEFPMNRIDHYYFHYARKISEIIGNMGLAKCFTELTLATERQMDMSHKIEKYIKDTDYILFKLMASAALLASEPRQNYFNVFYKNMTNEFSCFKNLQPQTMPEAELKQLVENLDTYSCSVMDGFKKCIGMLKELQV